MRKKWRLGLALLFIVAVFPVSTPLHSNEILVFGDSWAAPIGQKLQEILTESGNAAVTVRTTPFWQEACTMSTPTGLGFISDWLDSYPQANIVHLSLGANDIFLQWNPEMADTQQETTIINSIVECIETVADHVLSILPEAQVVWSSYDFFRPNSFGSPAEINRIHIKLADVAKQVAEDLQPKFVYIDMLGTFQVFYGFDGIQYTPFDPPFPIPPGDPSLPDPAYPSPLDPFPNDSNHPSPEGYRVLARTQYDLYYEALINDRKFYINSGLNDAWYNPETSGQGLLISTFPNTKQMFLAWFTYDTERPPDDATALLGEPGHRWLTAQGPYDGDTATLKIFVTKGGVFDSPVPAAETDASGDGKVTIEFADCEKGRVTYHITSLDISGTFPIQRITSDNLPLCETLADN